MPGLYKLGENVEFWGSTQALANAAQVCAKKQRHYSGRLKSFSEERFKTPPEGLGGP